MKADSRIVPPLGWSGFHGLVEHVGWLSVEWYSTASLYRCLPIPLDFCRVAGDWYREALLQWKIAFLST